MGSDHYCLRWNNHQSNLLGVFSQLLEAQSLVDVTLASSEGHSLRAHKVVLSACSTYFRALFLDHPARHPIVILKDVCFAELRTLVEFMYRGEVSVETYRLSALLKTAESLKVKGLAEMTALKSRVENGNSVDGNNGNGETAGSGTDNGGGVSAGETTTGGIGDDAGGSPPSPPQVILQQVIVPAGTTLSTTTPGATTPPPAHTTSPPSSHHPDRLCHPISPPDTRDSDSVQSGPSDMTLPTTAPLSPQSSANEPVPGPSGLPPVQDAPLSLKKEVDWDREDERMTGESSSDYRHPHDPENTEMIDGRIYSCMYCGAVFPHQSKLTRHILSHSLETLKYREQMFAAAAAAAAAAVSAAAPPPPTLLHPAPPHQQLSAPPSITTHLYGGPIMSSTIIKTEPPTSPLAAAQQQGGALCKFCGKTFPDVGTLINHLRAHTGDRPFKCEFCGKAFKLRHHMKDHCRVHTGERPFRCSLCGKTFSRSTILKAHEKTHYPKYMRKFLSSPSPEDERRTHELPPHLMPCDLTVESLCMPRPMACDLPPEPIYLPRTSSPSP